MVAPIHINGLSFSQTTAVPIDDLPIASADGDRLQALFDDGYDTAAVSNQTVTAMTREAVSASLEAAGLVGSEVEAWILSTESFWDRTATAETAAFGQAALRDDIWEGIIGPLGLQQALPYGNWLSGCANFASTLALAEGLLVSGRHANVLCALADRQTPATGRIAKGSSFVAGDMAAVFVLGGVARGPRIRHVVTSSSYEVWSAKLRGDPKGGVLAFQKVLARLMAAFERRAGRGPGRDGVVIVDNLNSAFVELAASALSLDLNRMLSPSKPMHGHAFACDCLLSLRQLEQIGDIAPGDVVTIINLGEWVFGIVELEWA